MRGRVLAFVFVTAFLSGQTYQRQAAISGEGPSGRGQCIVEVQVDSASEVQIRGTAGIASQWRRFDCTSPMPLHPNTFEFAAYTGRGQQRLVSDPSKTGVVIVELEDKLPGAALYSFTLTWDGDAESGSEPANSSVEAVEACQKEILVAATTRFKTGDIYFRRTSIENAQIRGTIDVNTRNQPYRFRFRCSTEDSQIEADPAEQGFRDYAYSGSGLDANRAIHACESAIDRRLADQGPQRAGFASIDIDEQVPDRVYGLVTVMGPDNVLHVLDLSCNVNFRTGAVNAAQAVARR